MNYVANQSSIKLKVSSLIFRFKAIDILLVEVFPSLWKKGEMMNARKFSLKQKSENIWKKVSSSLTALRQDVPKGHMVPTFSPLHLLLFGT